MRSSQAVAAVVLLTVACAFSAEHSHAVELGEASAGKSDVAEMSGAGPKASLKGADPRDALMTPWDKQGLKVIDAYANYNAKLQDDEKSLRQKLANPPDKSEPASCYHRANSCLPPHTARLTRSENSAVLQRNEKQFAEAIPFLPNS